MLTDIWKSQSDSTLRYFNGRHTERLYRAAELMDTQNTAGRSQKDFFHGVPFLSETIDVKIWIFGELSSKVQVKITVRLHLIPVAVAISHQENKQMLLRMQVEKGTLAQCWGNKLAELL